MAVDDPRQGARAAQANAGRDDAARDGLGQTNAARRPG
ncbi:hypothetical protein ACSSVZ_000078 [Amorphus sp. MBR-141]